MENVMENQPQNPPLCSSSPVMNSENLGKIEEELETKCFPNMEIDTTKTLAQIDAHFSSETALSASELGFAVRDHENGVRVSSEGLNGDDVCDVEVSNKTLIVEVEKDFGEHERQDDEKGLGDGDSSELIRDGSDKNEEFDQNGSLESANESGKDCGDEDDDKGFMAENGGDPDEKFVEILSLASKMGENGDATEEGERKQELKDNGKENEEDGENDEGDQEHEFLVGDFVWGEIRNFPWWPGRVYDPSDASEFARKKYKQSERLLVVYFGDGSFSWCSPSQLKPFADDFEEMSKQSDFKSFVNAVEKALEEIGRLVELKMTCSCIPEENRVGLARARPSAMNAGIKKGVLVPECDLRRLSIPQHGPELIATLRNIAEVVSIANMLELTVLKSFLSAFYRAKGGRKLRMYHEPQCIEGLEDKKRNGVTNFSGPVEVPVQGPSEEDWLRLPESHRFGQTNQSLLQKGPEISEDMLYHKRKKKSVADLMKEDMVVEPINKKGSRVKDVTNPSGRKKGRKRKAESEEETKDKMFSSENDDDDDDDDDDSNAKEETENVSASRERKKSRYLSPPYTSLKWRVRNSSSKRDSEAESMEFDTTDDSSEDQKKIIDSVEISASAKEVVSGVRSAALNPLELSKKISVDEIGGFISLFRSAIYVNGSNYKMYHKQRSGRKRKCSGSTLKLLEPDLNSTDHELLESKSQQKTNEKNEKAKSGKKKAKLKQASEVSGLKTKNNNAGEEAASTPVSLIVTFPPGISLPSKNQLIKKFRKFGPLNEMETDVLYNSFCARVVFVKSSDAEKAFKTSKKKNPLGRPNVNYQLRYSSAASRVPSKEGGRTYLNRADSRPCAVGEASRLLFIKKKLEKMTSMLEKSDGDMSAEMKAKLEGEMKGLLQTVSTMAESTSS
ncbi:Serine/threonine-protein kinase ATM [Camellia lanceoleosa]|uniref:Serine/threonine-protein kinase ATM n=1 Tax=Camellia lanceoleosa TaxID=1840588 RepID=A0ACC0J6L5_9ERIC|nr:Serine/threonine-protein kinase ATM [Camellia lanceoleosa]